MQIPTPELAASQYLTRFGIYAKREIVRQMLDAASKGDENSREYFHSILTLLINTEADNPQHIEYTMEMSESVSDILLEQLNNIHEQLKSDSDARKRYYAELCGTSATYIQALEAALVTMVREGEVGRPAALRVLRDGPPVWRRPMGGQPI